MAFCGSREFSHNHAGPSQARKACKANIKKSLILHLKTITKISFDVYSWIFFLSLAIYTTTPFRDSKGLWTV